MPSSAPTITPHPEGGYLLHCEYLAPRPVEEVFPFFADALNLAHLTPGWIKFNVLTPPNELRMREGLLIDYKLRIHGLPLRWQSEITAWEPLVRFVDEQRRGPYRYWRHEHLFKPTSGGTLVIDNVRYDVPGGRLMHSLFVRRDLTAIFRFRQEQLATVFAPAASDLAASGTPQPLVAGL